MTTYSPNFWSIIKINSDIDPHYRVFGSWSGSYLDGASWRMNSGIVQVEQDEDPNILNFIGSSKSIYKCHKKCYGFHHYGRSVFENYQANKPGIMEVMPEDTDWFSMDWIIKS